MIEAASQLVVAGKWAVPVEQRPKGWETWGVGEEIKLTEPEKSRPLSFYSQAKPLGIDITGSLKARRPPDRTCALPGCGKTFSPQNAMHVFCCKLCLSRRKDAMRKQRRAAGKRGIAA